MQRLSLVLVVFLSAGVAYAQPFVPHLPVPVAPPMIVPRPPLGVPPVYARPPVVGVPYGYGYYRPVNPYYARKARIFRGIGIPLLSVGVPLAVAGGIVWIVGAACSSCSSGVTHTGIGLFASGVGLFLPGAILTGIGNYYRWMSWMTAHADFGVAFAHDRGTATMRLRF